MAKKKKKVPEAPKNESIKVERGNIEIIVVRFLSEILQELKKLNGRHK